MTDSSKRLLLRAVQPAEEPVSLAEAKLYLRINSTAEDALLATLINAARMSAEEYTRKSFVTQSWRLAVDDMLPSETLLPRGPVSAITSITAFDGAGTPTSISASTYTLNAAKDTLLLNASVFAHRVEVVYVAGYGAANAVPAPLRLGILAHVSALYEHRGDAEEHMPAECIALYAPFREVRL